MKKSFSAVIVFILLSLNAEFALSFQVQAVDFDWENPKGKYSVRNYQVKDGLPLNSVNYVAHEPGGYLYAATNDGLARFDGNQFVVYSTFNSPTLRSNRIAWVSALNGETWFRDDSRFLYRIKNGKIECMQDIPGLEHVRAYKVEPRSATEILITTDHGFFIKKGEEFAFRQFLDERTQQHFENTFSFGEKRDFFITEKGLYQLRDEVPRLLLESSKLTAGVENIFNMIQTKNGELWLLGYNNTLTKITQDYSVETFSINGKPNAEFRDLIERSETELVASTNLGYFKFDRTTNEFSATEFTSENEPYFEDNAWNVVQDHLITVFKNTVFIDGSEVLTSTRQITFLTTDSEGNIWVATNGAGLFQIVENTWISIGRNEHPQLQNIYGVVESNDGIYSAAFENYMFKITEDKIIPLNRETAGFTNGYFRSVIQTANGEILAGSYDLWEEKEGVWKLNDSFREDNQLINSLFEDAGNTKWVGTDQGLYILEGESKSTFYDLENQTITRIVTIKQTSDGTLFFTTIGQGIAMLDKQGVFQFLNTDNGLFSNLVRDVHISSTLDTLWVAYEDKGLSRVIVDENRTPTSVHTVTTNDGLSDNSLHRIIEDEFGYFWINSNQGIMRISKNSLNLYLDGDAERLLMEIFGEQDGLLDIEGNGGTQHAGILTTDGKLLFANQAGLMYTRPEWFVEEERLSIPAPIIEDIQLTDSTFFFPSAEKLTLPVSNREAVIHFSVPTFTSPEKLEIDYRIKDINATWQKAGSERVANYSNLPAGEHLFEIRVRHNGEEDVAQSQILLVVPPLFRETGFFYALLVLGIGLLFAIGAQLVLTEAWKREQRLNDLVEIRTQDVIAEKEKTEQALKQLKSLSESKTRFFTNFTHELRTPLTLILNPLDDILTGERVNSASREQSLKLIKRNARRLKELVNTLLDVSKLSSDELKLNYQPVNIIEITRQITSQFEHEFKRKHIDLRIASTAKSAVLYVDVNAWDHICTNLIGNALKFTKSGGIIRIIIEPRETQTVISFTDTGIGIPESELPFIFDSYYQGDSTTNRTGGTGIGLTLVKGFVEQMKGAIDVSSTQNFGTTFSLTFPQGKAHLDDFSIISDEVLSSLNVETEQEITEEHTMSARIYNAPKVLLVEDNTDMREYIGNVIGTKYQLQTAVNGKEGLEAIKEYKPEIIVSDIMMPEMDGIEMMREIRKIEAYKNIPFIFLTAKDSASDIEKGLNLGADIYLTKPIENNVLLLQIKVLLRRETSLQIDEQASTRSILVEKVTAVIKRHLGNPDLSVDLIADAMNMSATSLYRKWKAESDITINKTIIKLRFEEAVKLVHEERLTISEAAYSVGFRHLSYFSRAFKKEYGVSPQDFFTKT